MAETQGFPPAMSNTSPDYKGLVQFLVEPLLESPESLKVDCEIANEKQRVWIRVAFEGEDKGRVFGRGGRNLQAIETVLKTAATMAGQSIYLDIYGSESRSARQQQDSCSSYGRKLEGRKVRPRPSVNPRFKRTDDF